MAHFIYFKTSDTAVGSADRCFKIVNPGLEQVYSVDDSELVDDAAAVAAEDGSFTNLTRVEGLHGYPVTIPSDLPTGDYDILFFNGTAAEMEADTSIAVEEGFGFKWNKDRQHISARREILTDLVT